MNILECKLVKVKVKEIETLDKNGQPKIEKKFQKLGVRLNVDGTVIFYSFRSKKYSVKCPPRKLTYRSGSATGEVEAGQRFFGISKNELKRSFGAKMVEVIESEMWDYLQ